MQMVLTPVAPNQFKASAHKCDLRQDAVGPACGKLPGGCAATGHRILLTRSAKTRRLRTARQEIRPRHTVDTQHRGTASSKVERMQATPRWRTGYKSGD